MKMTARGLNLTLHSAVCHGHLGGIKTSDMKHLVNVINDGGPLPSEETINNYEQADRLSSFTILSYLFDKMEAIEAKNEDVHSVCVELSQDDKIFKSMMFHLKHGDRFLSHVCAKCLISMMKTWNDKVTIEQKLEVILNHYKTDASWEVQNRFLWLSSEILSGKTSNFVLKRTLVAMLQSRWNGLYASWKQNSEHVCCIESIMPFLMMWKKVIKFERTLKDSDETISKRDILELMDATPSMLWDILDARVGHNHLIQRKLFDILNTALGHVECLMDQQHKHCYNLARASLTKVVNGILEKLPNDFEMVSFGGTVRCRQGPSQGSKPSCDSILLRKMSLSILKSTTVVLNETGQEVLATKAIEKLEKCLERSLALTDATLKDSILFLFGEQDDSLTESVMLMLLIYQQLKGCTSEALSIIKSISPHGVFLDFLANISFDQSVMLDYLTSPETCFLMYLTKYLRLMLAEWENFVETCRQHSGNQRESCCEKPHSDVCSGSDSQSNNKGLLSKDVNLLEAKNDGNDIGTLNSLSVEPNVESSVKDSTANGRATSRLNGCRDSPEPQTVPSKGLRGLVDYSSSEGSDESGSEVQDCDTETYSFESIRIKTETDENKTLGSYSQTLPSGDFDATHNVLLSKNVKLSDKIRGAVSEHKSNDTVLQENVFKVPDSRSRSDGLIDECEDSSSQLSDSSAILRSLRSDEAGERSINSLLDQTMTALIRLRMSIQRLHCNKLFPYNPTLLIGLIETCEDLYES